MKKVLLPIIASLLLICSCHRRPVYPPQFYVADSLASVQPDSAIALLEALKADSPQWDKATQMYHNLLTVKARDKAYITHTSDSLMLSVLNYYEHGGDKQLLPEAYYYMGRTYRDMNDAPRALEYYQKAVDMMPGEEHLKIKTKVYAQIGSLFLYQRLYDKAMSAFKNSYQCDSILKDTVGIIYNLRDMALCYANTNRNEIGIEYLKQAIGYAENIKNERMSLIASSQLASLYLQRGDYELAYDAIKPSLNNINTANVSSVYSIVASVHQHLNHRDSASYYYNKLLVYGDTYAKAEAYFQLAKMSIENSKDSEVVSLLDNYYKQADARKSLTATETVAQMNSLYNYQLYVDRANKAITDQKNTQLLVLLLGILLLFLVALGVLLYMRFSYNHKQKSLELAKAKLEQENLQKLISDHINTIEQLKTDQIGQSINIDQLNSIIKEKELLISQYRNQSIEISNRYFKETSWYKEIMNRSIDVKNPKLLKPFTEKEQAELKHEVFNIYSSYIDQLKANHPELDDDKLLLLCLDALKLKGLSMALCFGFTDPHVIYTRKARLREELGFDADIVT
ncbi:MAG: tetratricopeptide repeat protein [Bacteroidaceae bacterium]|nr:tetratricopeptide repeat protein [Bacteroidaceae bacterium]